MRLRRSLKTIGAKWWIVVLAALLGAFIGVTLARTYNDSIKPLWRAEAPVAFIQLDESDENAKAGSSSQSADQGAIDVQAERARAELLLEESLLANPRLSITANRVENTLSFGATGRSGEDTLSAALALRDEYDSVGATVLSIEQITATMDSLLIDIDRIGEQVTDIEVGEPESEDVSVTTARTAFETEIQTLNERQAQLRIWLVNPELRPTEEEYLAQTEGVEEAAPREDEPDEDEPVIVTPETLRAERDANQVIIDRLVVSLSVIPDPPVAEELDAETELELEALNLDLTELKAQYVDLLRRSEGRPPGGFYMEPVVTNETTSEIPVTLAGFVGSIAGAMFGLIGLFVLDRARRPIWASSDIEGTAALGIVDRDRSDGPREAIWYPASVSHRRRDIQVFRAAIDAVTEEVPSVVGLTAVGVSSEEVGEVAADLASAYVVAGREVLLIDGSGSETNSLPEFGPHSDDLNEILTTQLSQSDVTVAINQLLEDAPPVAPHLTSVRVGGPGHDPIDAFASPNCRLLMDIARWRYDVVILAGPDVADALSDAVARRVDFIVLVGQIGHTKTSQIEAALDVLADRRTEVAGALLLNGRRQSFTGGLRAAAAGDPDAAAEAPAKYLAGIMARVKGFFSDRPDPVDESDPVGDQADQMQGLVSEPEAETSPPATASSQHRRQDPTA